MYLSSPHDSLLLDHIPIRVQPIIRGDSGPDSNANPFNLNCDNKTVKDTLVSVSEGLPVSYQQGGETYYVARQWQGQTDAPLRDLQQATVTNRKVIQNADFKFSRTEELSFENSRYHKYVTDCETNVSAVDNDSGLGKSELNVRSLLKENVKQYAKIVNTLPVGGGDSDDLSSAMFRQMAASCGIHVEDPRSFSEHFELQKHPNLSEDTLSYLEPSVLNRTENPFGDGLSDLDSDLQSLKLEYAALEMSSKNSALNLSTAWNPNWMNASFYSSKAESYTSSPYNSKSVSENDANPNESSVGFESSDAGENATKPVIISDQNESSNASTQSLCFTPIKKKDWPNNFFLDSSPLPSYKGMPVNMSTPLRPPGFGLRDRGVGIMNVSTQTDFILSPNLGVPRKQMFSQGNQASVLLKDASVNTWKLCNCSDFDPPSQFGSPLPSAKNMEGNAWSPLSDTEDLNKQLLVDQNLNPTCLTDNYFNEQYTGVAPSTILQSSLRNPYRGDSFSVYKASFPDVSPVLNTPPPSPETSDVSFWGTTLRQSDNFYLPEPNINSTEIKLDFNLYCLVLDKLRHLYPGLAKSPHELQLLAKRQTLALQFHKSQLQYSCAEEPRAITKTNPLHLSSPKDIDSNKFFHNLSTTLSSNDRDIDYLTPEESPSSTSSQRSADDFRYGLGPTYRKFPAQPFPSKSEWNSKPFQDHSPKSPQVEWEMGFNPAVTKHVPKKDSDLFEEHQAIGSPKMIMKRVVDKGGWNSPTLPISVNGKSPGLKYPSPCPEECSPVGSSEFQTNNWQQIIKKKKRLQFAAEQNKQTLPGKIDANTRKGNYERLVQVILERLPDTDRTKVDELIREVRRRKNGLGGLTMREIVLEAKSIQHEKTRLYTTTPTMVNNENQCALCVEELKLKPQKLLECGHNFHEECILAWVYRHKRSCPTCGQLVLFPEDYPKLA